jgi:hypothetical protein
MSSRSAIGPAAGIAAGVRWELRTLAGKYPSVALPLLRWRSGRGPAQFLAPLDARTEIVIEGFPRSGNTFVVAAFHLAQQPKDVRIAHHAHLPAQLIGAARLGLPALALIREPEESVLSFMVREPALSIDAVLRGYVRFHEPLLSIRQAMVVATFQDATTDLATVIRRVNERFGTSFREFEHTEANVRRVMALVEEGDLQTFGDRSSAERRGGRPSPTRRRMKDELRARYRSPALSRLRRRADRAYRSLADAPAGSAPGTRRPRPNG